MKEKILLKINSSAAAELVRIYREQCEFINENVESVLDAYELEHNAKNAIKAVFNPQEVENAFLASFDAGISHLPKSVRGRLHIEERESKAEHRKILFALGKGIKRDFIIQNEMAFTPDVLAIEESFKTYLTDEPMAVYKRIQAIADSLNELFAGNPPLFWMQVFTLKDGKFGVNEDVDFEQLTKK